MLRAVFVAAVILAAVSPAPVEAQQPDAGLQKTIDDYLGLYTRDTLEQWKALFLPGFVASYTSADGSVSSRTLDEFYERQRTAFAAGEVSETMHNVRVSRDGKLAHVAADFRFTSGGNTRPGKLMLLLIEEKGQFRIAALTFTYQ